MTLRAYILIESEAGMIPNILEEIKNIKEVKKAYAITGHYDLIVEIESNSHETLAKITFLDIHNIRGVSRTTTCNVLNRS